MLSGSVIRQIAEEAGQRARNEGKVPYPVSELNLDSCPPFPFPNMGDYCPDGWRRACGQDGTQITLFCDKTGFDDSGPALSVRQLVAKLQEWQKYDNGYALGIIEEGQFQIVLGAFLPAYGDFTHSGLLTRSERKIAGG